MKKKNAVSHLHPIRENISLSDYLFGEMTMDRNSDLHASVV